MGAASPASLRVPVQGRCPWRVQGRALVFLSFTMTDPLRLLAASSPGETRVALVRGAALLAYAIERPGAPDGVGDLHRGRIAARRTALGGSFVALDGGVQGFLPDSEGALGLAEGALLGGRGGRGGARGRG